MLKELMLCFPFTELQDVILVESLITKVTFFLNDLVEAFLEFQDGIKPCKVLEKFICRGSLREKDNAITLDKARWTLFKRSSAVCQKLPPTHGAFVKHLRRSFIQINIWANACTATIPVLDPLQYGWKREGNSYFPGTTNDDIAPFSVINLVTLPM